jgi:hypothetical protein
MNTQASLALTPLKNQFIMRTAAATLTFAQHLPTMLLIMSLRTVGNKAACHPTKVLADEPGPIVPCCVGKHLDDSFHSFHSFHVAIGRRYVVCPAFASLTSLTSKLRIVLTLATGAFH